MSQSFIARGVGKVRRILGYMPLVWAQFTRRLPPGRFNPCDRGPLEDQRYLLDRYRDLGPIFTGNNNGRWTTFVVGHPLIRRLLGEHPGTLPCSTIDLTPLFPIGFVRSMEGDTHASYRRHLVQAMQSVSLSEHELSMRQRMKECLDEIGAISRHGATMDSMGPVLRTTTSTILLRLLFGIEPASQRFAPLREASLSFSPKEPEATIGPSQLAAFKTIQSLLEAEILHSKSSEHGAAASSMLKHLVAEGALDETLLGNLIYMHEASHFDLYGLWRWIMRHVADRAEISAHLRALDDQQARLYARAIVQETLRLDQSEALVRPVSKGFELDGFHIPPGSDLRLCLWEGHKDPVNFPDPFAFDPERFIGQQPSPDEYAPFGFGRHRCFASDFVLYASTLFVVELLKRFDIGVVTDKPPFRGKYHWQPHPEMTLRFCPVP